MTADERSGRTEGERRVLAAIDDGISTPSEIASALGVSVSAVSQQLRRLVDKGAVSRRRLGRSAEYRRAGAPTLQGSGAGSDAETEDWGLLRDSLEALNKVWSHLLRLRLTPEELRKLREARNLLEEVLHERGVERP